MTFPTARLLVARGGWNGHTFRRPSLGQICLMRQLAEAEK